MKPTNREESLKWRITFSRKTLGDRLYSVPLLLLLLPFVVGIALAEYCVIPLWLVVGALSLSAVMCYVAMESRIALLYVALMAIMAGYLVSEISERPASMPYDRAVEMVIDLRGVPAQRDGYRVAEGRLVEWRDQNATYEANDRVQLWLRSDSIDAGDRVVVWSTLRKRMSRYEGYNDLLSCRGYVGGVAIADYNIISHEQGSTSSLQQRAIEKLAVYQADSASHATVEAMVAGSRHALPNYLREGYSATGLSHLMAVSGLHLGIVLMVVTLLLAPISLIHRGHIVAKLLSIVALWLFAIMSGLSPSVVRAAIMFTVLQLSTLSTSPYNPINSLAATLLIMLVIRPGYLFDISFQLSSLAVMGILAWGVPLTRLLPWRNWLLRHLTSALVIGAVATLWTLPVVSHTFGSLPLAGVVLTPVVIICAYLIVAFGLFGLLFPAPLSLPFVAMGEWCAKVQNSIVLWASEHHLTGIEYEMPLSIVALCYITIAIITLVVWAISRKRVVVFHQLGIDEEDMI